MYAILYNLFFELKRKERQIHSEKFSRFCRKYYDLFDIYLNVIFRKFITVFGRRKSGVTKKKRKQKVIVSLTSFPMRIETVYVTIETIFRQSVKADEVILWLAESQFDGFDSLPESLKKLCKRGLTIRFCDDIKSHKKYYYVFHEYQNDLVITFDDDMFYPKDTIKKLLQLHRKYPEDVISISSQCIPEDISKLPSVWNSLREQVISSKKAQPFTGAGTLFQPYKYNKVLYNKELIRELAPYADDLWIYIVGYISGINVTTIEKPRCFYPSIWGTDESSLFNLNGVKGKNYNDIQWERLVKYFMWSDNHGVNHNNADIQC